MKNFQIEILLSVAMSSAAEAYWGDSPGSDSSGSGAGLEPGDPSTSTSYGSSNIESAMSKTRIHGILAAVAFVILFPLGGAFMRIIPGRFAIWSHGLTQLIAYVLFIAATALGFIMVQDMQIPLGGGSFLTNPSTSYHPIIGIVVFVTLFFQPMLGFIHHVKFKKLQRRTAWSHLHVWNGRAIIILGIVNGGLGLRLAGASDTVKLAYTILAAIMGSFWLVLAVISTCRRIRDVKEQPNRLERVASERPKRSGNVR